jgi:hypothetical protein
MYHLEDGGSQGSVKSNSLKVSEAEQEARQEFQEKLALKELLTDKAEEKIEIEVVLLVDTGKYQSNE